MSEKLEFPLSVNSTVRIEARGIHDQWPWKHKCFETVGNERRLIVTKTRIFDGNKVAKNVRWTAMHCFLHGINSRRTQLFLAFGSNHYMLSWQSGHRPGAVKIEYPNRVKLWKPSEEFFIYYAFSSSPDSESLSYHIVLQPIALMRYFLFKLKVISIGFVRVVLQIFPPFH